jgi:uncharacterized protein YllA (UPF0747 family)
MATEDHDFEEINHFKAEGEVFSIREESGGAVGRIQVSDLDFIQNFENSFKDRKFGGDLIDLMKSSYKEGETLAQATRKLVHQLFSEYGLLMIDGDDKRLKALMKETFQKELTENLLYKSTQKTILDLKQHYGKVQVNPREINLFYLEKTRNRIEFDGEKFVVVDTSLQFSKEEILEGVWGFDTEVETRVTDETLRRIRRKLSLAGSNVSIGTIWGFGYRISIAEDKK